MTFPFSVYALALAGGFVTTLVALPLWRAWCRRIGLVDDPGQRKIHQEPVPLAGGLAVFTGMIVPLALGILVLRLGWLDLPTSGALGHGYARRAPQLMAVLAGALGMVLLGWLDDRHELSAGRKFAGQVLIALLVAACGVRATLFVPSLVFSLAVTTLWIVAVTNAFNFLDNMNGLCAGLGAIGAGCFALKAAVAGQYLVAALAFLATSALLGFLPYNFPRASAFLGDAGSHLVGFLLAVLAILPDYYSPGHPVHLAVLNPLLILAVALGDMAWVVVWRWRRGLPVYVGDTNHLSHRLVRRGLAKSTAVLWIWLLAAATGALAFL
jgi:UDP-GlcNAc:undecaprenyl-phosphate GlcNAc-1-phosphate transferase